MNAFGLIAPYDAGDRFVAWACAVCLEPYRTRDLAEGCCHPCATCGKILDVHVQSCNSRSCVDARHKAFRAKLQAQAIKIPESEYDGAVYWEDQDRYFASVSDLYEWALDEERPTPAWVWACTTYVFQVNIDRELETEDEALGVEDGLMDQLVDLDALRTFVAEWNKKQTACSWYEDVHRVVVLKGEP